MDLSIPTKARRDCPADGSFSNERLADSDGREKARELFDGCPYPGHFSKSSPTEAARKGQRGRDGVLPRNLERQSVSEELVRCMTPTSGSSNAAAGPMTDAHAASSGDSEATRVKNEGAFPFVDARTARMEEGSDDVTLMPPADR